jgi:hypothetical protein
MTGGSVAEAFVTWLAFSLGAGVLLLALISAL